VIPNRPDRDRTDSSLEDRYSFITAWISPNESIFSGLAAIVVLVSFPDSAGKRPSESSGRERLGFWFPG
jgi:hypothetical protein